ncbi:hypothetical protein AJ79_00288 [Helicocarpus griseus UAMH5409]|uniref:Myb-like domain-containing protein n=1 Tax=Helicocarpus griseus UAMH5409 TaxID=1447875 RepID=A0A2B7YDC5_9EURO|nr:hypothetical protein AJ79_00288 [Helicocarpus griseus UAMH5409]
MTSPEGNKPTRQRKGNGAISKSNTQKGKRILNRPKRREIVRWNENLNNKLLLSIQSACSAQNVKIPWQEVAELMGGSISSGAINQHLAKLRKAMEANGHDTPPPLKRGGGVISGPAITPAAKRTTASRPKVKLEWDDSDSESDYNPKDGRAGAAFVKEDNRSDSNNEYVAVGASFLHFPDNPESTPHYHQQNHVQSHATSSSGGSPQQKLVKLRVGKGAGGKDDGSYEVAGVDTNVEVLGQQLSGQNLSSASSQTVPSPEGDMQAGNGSQVASQEIATQRHAPQYGWSEAQNGRHNVLSTDVLRQGGHLGNSGSSFQQHNDHFSMTPDMAMLHGANPYLPAGYRESMNVFPHASMPHAPGMHPQAFTAGMPPFQNRGMWNVDDISTQPHTYNTSFSQMENLPTTQDSHVYGALHNVQYREDNFTPRESMVTETGSPIARVDRVSAMEEQGPAMEEMSTFDAEMASMGHIANDGFGTWGMDGVFDTH